MSVPRIKGIFLYYYVPIKGTSVIIILCILYYNYGIACNKKYCALTSVINSENQKNYVDKMIIIIMHLIMIQSSDIYLLKPARFLTYINYLGVYNFHTVKSIMLAQILLL